MDRVQQNLNQKSTLRDDFSGVSEEMLSLLESLLTFDHTKRPSVKEIIGNKVFDEIRWP